MDESHHTDEDYNGLNNDDDEDIVPLDKDFKRDSDLGFPSSSKDEYVVRWCTITRYNNMLALLIKHYQGEQST